MARNLYDMGDQRPADDPSWLNEKQERRARILPVGLLILFVTIGSVATMMLRQALPSPDDKAARAAAPASIAESFILCDDPKGAACVLSANAYAWRGRRYHLADISVPGQAGARCPLEAKRAAQARAALAAMMNGGAFEARPDPTDADPAARILTRDGVSIGQLMILKRYARPWSRKPFDWCAA